MLSGMKHTRNMCARRRGKLSHHNLKKPPPKYKAPPALYLGRNFKDLKGALYLGGGELFWDFWFQKSRKIEVSPMTPKKIRCFVQMLQKHPWHTPAILFWSAHWFRNFFHHREAKIKTFVLNFTSIVSVSLSRGNTAVLGWRGWGPFIWTKFRRPRGVLY